MSHPEPPEMEEHFTKAGAVEVGVSNKGTVMIVIGGAHGKTRLSLTAQQTHKLARAMIAAAETIQPGDFKIHLPPSSDIGPPVDGDAQ